MIQQFRKKPVVIQACEWDGTQSAYDELIEWGAPIHYLDQEAKLLVVETLEDGPGGEAKHIASVGDFIVRGVKGEFYPCKPDIFYLTYEEANV